jgi:N-formylglutamate deformylase
MSEVFTFRAGTVPLLISMPHVGTQIAPEVQQQLLPEATVLADTDWHLPSLYNMAEALGASLLVAQQSRYVIDLNRAPDNANLYPGQDTTGLCPVDTFHKQALYAEGKQPGALEIDRRINTYWQPYHQQLQGELQRLKQQFGTVVLWDAHSIASVVPRFFEGKLPDLNFGTADGKSCDAGLSAALADVLQGSAHTQPYSHVFNGRFKGGYITRQYGQPQQNIHAIQLEMAQCVYMNEAAPFAYLPEKAAQVQPLLRELLQACVNWAQAQQKG